MKTLKQENWMTRDAGYTALCILQTVLDNQTEFSCLHDGCLDSLNTILRYGEIIEMALDLVTGPEHTLNQEYECSFVPELLQEFIKTDMRDGDLAALTIELYKKQEGQQ